MVGPSQDGKGLYFKEGQCDFTKEILFFFFFPSQSLIYTGSFKCPVFDCNTHYLQYSSKIYLFLLKRLSYREREVKRERFHVLVLSNGYKSRSGVVQRQELVIPLHGSSEPRIWAIIYCFPRCISKELNQKLSSLELN